MKTLKNYHLTDASESVAWNGTLYLIKNEETGKTFLEYHSGNGAHPTTYTFVKESDVNMVENLSKEDALLYHGNYFNHEHPDKFND